MSADLWNKFEFLSSCSGQLWQAYNLYVHVCIYMHTLTFHLQP